VLQADRDASTLGRLRLDAISSGAGRAPAPAAIDFFSWFELLHGRRSFQGPISAEWHLELEWT
jgi:hypothetical protein